MPLLPLRRAQDAASIFPPLRKGGSGGVGWAGETGLTSIMIVTCNQLAYTKECIDSIRLRTDEPYELILCRQRLDRRHGRVRG